MQELTGTRVFRCTQLIQFAMHRLAIFIPSAPRYNIQLPLNPFILIISSISQEVGWTYETHISPSRQNFIHSSQPNRRANPLALLSCLPGRTYSEQKHHTLLSFPLGSGRHLSISSNFLSISISVGISPNIFSGSTRQ
jgi:hypothetical protein